MDPAPKTPRKSLLDGLTRILHLHQLPEGSAPASSKMVAPVSAAVPTPQSPVAAPPVPRAATPVQRPPAAKKGVAPKPVPVMPAMKFAPGAIVTDYDRILEVVRRNQAIKLDEIARLLALKEEQVAQELQTLEDNGLVEVKYPAFGEPLICFKVQES